MTRPLRQAAEMFFSYICHLFMYQEMDIVYCELALRWSLPVIEPLNILYLAMDVVRAHCVKCQR